MTTHFKYILPGVLLFVIVPAGFPAELYRHASGGNCNCPENGISRSLNWIKMRSIMHINT